MEPVGDRIFFAGEALGGSLVQTCAGPGFRARLWRSRSAKR